MLAQQLTNGLMMGLTYALITFGYALVFGSLGRLNLAHGENMILGGYFGYNIYHLIHLPFIPLLLVVAILSAVVGVGIYYVSFRYISPKYEMASLVSTLAIATALQSLMINVFGSESKPFPNLVGGDSIHIGSVLISPAQIVVAITAIVLFVALFLLISKSRVGSAIRAISESASSASVVGIQVNRTVVTVFAISGALAGVAGMMIGTLYGLLTPALGVDIGLKGIAVMIIGGLGNLRGAAVAALLLGIGEALAAGYIGAAGRDALAWVLLLAILVVRPGGLFGTQVAEPRD